MCLDQRTKQWSAAKFPLASSHILSLLIRFSVTDAMVPCHSGGTELRQEPLGALLHIMENTQGKLHRHPRDPLNSSAEGSVWHNQCCSKAQSAPQSLKKDVGFNLKPHFGQNMIQHGLLPSNHRETSLLCCSLPVKSNL